MRIPVDYTDDRRIRAAFSWLTRIGAGRYFPGTPIGWYQIHQCAALDILEALLPQGGPVRCTDGVIYSGKTRLISARDLFEQADRKARS